MTGTCSRCCTYREAINNRVTPVSPDFFLNISFSSSEAPQSSAPPPAPSHRLLQPELLRNTHTHRQQEILRGLAQLRQVTHTHRQADNDRHKNKYRCTNQCLCVFSGFVTEAEGAGDRSESSTEAPWQRAPVVHDNTPYVTSLWPQVCLPSCRTFNRRRNRSSFRTTSDSLPLCIALITADFLGLFKVKLTDNLDFGRYVLDVTTIRRQKWLFHYFPKYFFGTILYFPCWKHTSVCIFTLTVCYLHKCSCLFTTNSQCTINTDISCKRVSA